MDLGLTGGIACGKSTISQRLAEKGALIIDADKIAREIVEPEQPAWQDIVDWFGPKILKDDRSLNRELLAQIIFSDPRARRRLTDLTKPRVLERMELQKIKARQRNPALIIVFDIPLLIEEGLQNIVDKVLLVVASEEVQIERLMKRDGLTREEALKRIRSQMPLAEKIKYAHYILNNSGSREEAFRQLDRIWVCLQAAQRKSTKCI